MQADLHETGKLVEGHLIGCVLYGKTLAAAGHTLEEARGYVETDLAKEYVEVGWKAVKYDSLKAHNEALLGMAVLDNEVRAEDL